MIKCPIHGISLMYIVCTHLGEAVDADRFERAHLVVDCISNHLVLACERCRSRAGRQLEVVTTDSSGRRHRPIDPMMEPQCRTHVVEWYSATGQGDLLDQEARTKAALSARRRGDA